MARFSATATRNAINPEAPTALSRQANAGEEALHVVAQGGARAVEGEVVPGDVFGRERAHLQALVARLQLPAHDLGRVDDHHHLAAGVRIRVEDAGEADAQVHLLPRLAHRRAGHCLPAVHEAAGEDPLPQRRLDGSPQQYDPAVDHADGAGGHLGVEVEDEPALRADQPFRLPRRDDARLERAAAANAEPVFAWRHGLGHGAIIGPHPARAVGYTPRDPCWRECRARRSPASGGWPSSRPSSPPSPGWAWKSWWRAGRAG